MLRGRRKTRRKNPDCRLTSRPSASDFCLLYRRCRYSCFTPPPSLDAKHHIVLHSSGDNFSPLTPREKNETTSRMSTPSPLPSPLLFPPFPFHIISVPQGERFHSVLQSSAATRGAHFSRRFDPTHRQHLQVVSRCSEHPSQMALIPPSGAPRKAQTCAKPRQTLERKTFLFTPSSKSPSQRLPR